MSQQSFHQQTANGSNIAFTITTFSEDEIKVYVDGVESTNGGSNQNDYTIPNYTTTGGTVTWNTSGSLTAPASPSVVRVVRQTDVMNNGNTAVEGRATFQAGSSVKADDLNNNTKQTLRALQEQQDQKVQSYDFEAQAVNTAAIKDLNVTRGKIAADAIDGTKLADNAVDSEHYTDGSIDTDHIGNLQVTTSKLADNAVTTVKITDANVTTAKIADSNVTTAKIAADAVNGTKIADNSIDSEHYVDGSIDTAHIGDSQVTTAKLDDNAVTTNKIQNNAVTFGKLATGAIITNSEQSNPSFSGNDTSIFTTSASDARYFNISSGETIKDGQTFPDNDTSIATTAAINDRIIDLVDDVGGFVPIANETSFPTSNPDVNDGAGTIVSVSAASTNLVPSGTTVTIANGRGSGLPVVITGVSATIPSGFGFLVETTTTDHTYTFHRLSPKATEVTTVAGISGNVTTVAGIAANTTTVAGISSDVTTVAGIASNVTSVANNESNINSAVSNASNINSAVSNASNINTVAGSISNVNNVGNSISSVNNASSNLNSINNFGDKYQVAANNPSTDGGGNALAAGDLYFNTSANELKVYNGSAWQGGVTATGNFAVTTGNTFTGDNRNNDGVKALFGTGSDLEVYHNGTNSHIDHVGTGDFFIRTVGSGDKDLFLRANNDVFIKPQLNENGISAIGNGQVELYYDGGKKFSTTSTGAYVNGSLGIGTTSALDKIEVQNGAVLVGHTTNATAVRTLLQGYGYKIGSNLYGNVSIRSSYNHNSNSGSLDFYTASGGTNTTERVKITSDGHLQVFGQIQIPNDLGKITLGTGQDLEIFHDGAHSRIKDVGTGGLLINASEFAVKSPIGENVLRGVQNDAAELYYDGVKKLETRSTGIYVSGLVETGTFLATSTSEFQNNVKFDGGTPGVDINFFRSNNALGFSTNAKANFGSSGNFSIYYDGTDNILKGDSSTVFRNAANNETLAKFTPNGSVELYHDNTKRYETHAYGSKITASGAEPHGSNATSRAALNLSGQFGGGLALDDLGNGGFTHFLSGSGAVYNISTAVAGLSTEKCIEMNRNGNVELYYDNSEKLRTRSNGITVTGYTYSDGVTIGNGTAYKYLAGDSNQLQMYHTGTGGNGYLVNSTGTLHIGGGTVGFTNAATNAFLIRAVSGGASELYHNGTKKFETDSNGVLVSGRLKIPDNDGNGQQLVVGNSADLKLYHDGSNSYIQHGTVGNLRYQSGNHDFYNQDGTEFMCRMFNNGSVNLYYDNVLKFRTSSIGTTTDGNAVINNVTGGNALTINLADATTDSVQINGGSNQARTILRMQQGNSNSNSSTGYRIARADGTDVMNLKVDHHHNYIDMMNLVQNGFIRFFTSSSENNNGSVHVVSISSRGSIQGSGDGTARPAYAFTNDTDTGMYRRSSNVIGFSTAGVARYFMSGGAFAPHQDNADDLGGASNRWDDVRATNTNIQSSDRTEKNTINPTDLGLDFINKLVPVSYKWNKTKNGVGKRTHYGLIAQDVETTLKDIGKTGVDFAGFCYDKPLEDADGNTIENPKEYYGLRYGEFMAPMIKAIQELSTEVNNLKTKVAALEAA